jgi:outer membrane protein assembly factor BamB
VVVTAERPRYCGLVVAATATAAVATIATLVVGTAALDAQGRRRRAPPPKPATLLLPAEPAWTVMLPEPPMGPGVAAGTVVVVPLEPGELRAFDWTTGEPKWAQEFATTVTPVAAGTRVVAATTTLVQAFDAVTGGPAWQHAPASPPSSLVGTSTDVYVLDRQGVTAVDAASGRVRWQSSADGAALSLAAGPRGVAVTQNDSRVMLFAVADGRRLWVRQFDGALRTPAWAGKTLLVPSAGRTVWALDGDDGSISWEWTLGNAAVGVAGDADRVYIAALDNVLRAVNRGNGHQRWQETLGTRAQLAPLALDGAVLVAGLSPPLSLFNSLTGAPIGTHVATAGLVGPPLVDPVIRPGAVAIVLVLRDGRLVGLRSVALQFRELPLTPFTALPGRTLPRERLP